MAALAEQRAGRRRWDLIWMQQSAAGLRQPENASLFAVSCRDPGPSMMVLAGKDRCDGSIITAALDRSPSRAPGRVEPVMTQAAAARAGEAQDPSQRLARSGGLIANNNRSIAAGMSSSDAIAQVRFHDPRSAAAPRTEAGARGANHGDVRRWFCSSPDTAVLCPWHGRAPLKPPLGHGRGLAAPWPHCPIARRHQSSTGAP